MFLNIKLHRPKYIETNIYVEKTYNLFSAIIFVCYNIGNNLTFLFSY